MRKRVFITGISSPLIQGLVQYFRESQYDIIGLSRRNVTIQNARIIKGDIQNVESFKSELTSCEMILHGAAITHSHDDQAYFNVNYLASKALADCCRRNQRFVFISSRTAGPDSGAYGKSKWLAENYIKERFDKYLILSPSEVFGVPKGEGIEQLIRDAVSKRLHVYPIGVESPLSPIHKDDLTREMVNAIQNENWPKDAVILNGSWSGQLSELIKKIGAFTGRRTLLIPIPKWMMMILAKAAKVFPGLLPFTADQVDRLYAIKPISNVHDNYISIENYVESELL